MPVAGVVVPRVPLVYWFPICGLSRTVLALTFLGMVGSVVAMAVSYLKG